MHVFSVILVDGCTSNNINPTEQYPGSVFSTCAPRDFNGLSHKNCTCQRCSSFTRTDPELWLPGLKTWISWWSSTRNPRVSRDPHPLFWSLFFFTVRIPPYMRGYSAFLWYPRRSPDVGLMLKRRLRRRSNIEPTPVRVNISCLLGCISSPPEKWFAWQPCASLATGLLRTCWDDILLQQQGSFIFLDREQTRAERYEPMLRKRCANWQCVLGQLQRPITSYWQKSHNKLKWPWEMSKV